MKSIFELAAGKRLRDLTPEELQLVLEQLRHNIESWKEEPETEFIPSTMEELYALGPETIGARIDLLQDQMELDEKKNELDRRAINLGLLKMAAKAPRCSRLKSNGEPCRAPAMGDRSFCVFHARALEADDQPRMKVDVLEDRESLQLTLKQIMERIVAGSIPPQHAALLLRAVRIADAALRSRHFDPPKQSKPMQRPGYPSESWGNPEENSA